MFWWIVLLKYLRDDAMKSTTFHEAKIAMYLNVKDSELKALNFETKGSLASTHSTI